MGLHKGFVLLILKWPQIKQNKISFISKVNSITVQSDIWQLKRNCPLLLCSAEQKYECGKIYAFKTDAWSNFSIHYSNQSALTRGAKRLISLVFHTLHQKWLIETFLNTGPKCILPCLKSENWNFPFILFFSILFTLEIGIHKCSMYTV